MLVLDCKLATHLEDPDFPIQDCLLKLKYYTNKEH